MCDSSANASDGNSEKKNIELSGFPDGFEFKTEYKLYKHFGNASRISSDGESHFSNYVAWNKHIKQYYNGLNADDRLQFKWALRDKKKFAELERTIVASVLLAVFAMIMPPLIDLCATQISQKSETDNASETTTECHDESSIEINDSLYEMNETDGIEASENDTESDVEITEVSVAQVESSVIETTEISDESNTETTNAPGEQLESSKTELSENGDARVTEIADALITTTESVNNSETQETAASEDKSKEKPNDKQFYKAMATLIAGIIVEGVVVISCFKKLDEFRFAEEILLIIEQIESDKKARIKSKRRKTVVR